MKRLSKKHRSIYSDVRGLVGALENNPYLGDRLTENVYKIRLAIRSKGKGKSGGARVITFINIVVEAAEANQEANVDLLEIYDKPDVENLPLHIIRQLETEAAQLEKSQEEE